MYVRASQLERRRPNEGWRCCTPVTHFHQPASRVLIGYTNVYTKDVIDSSRPSEHESSQQYRVYNVG